MKHLGDITKIDGSSIEAVDCITFGSPCQDLSVAGNRKGLNGERSGLFMEAVRIIKEMRNNATERLCVRGADEHIRYIQPRFAIWENVPGAFSSNNGEDFRVVLEELVRIKEPSATIPRPKDNKGRDTKWSSAGYIEGDEWSIAWRMFDAQYWGVPQRRKRIALVVDFDGRRAAEILFESEGLLGNTEKSE